METLDIVVLIPVIYFGFKGFQSGLLKEVLSLVGLILAVFLTLNYLDEFTSYAKQITGLKEIYNPFVMGFILFVGVMLLTTLIIHFASKFINAIQLSTVNKLLGLAFGSLKAAIMVSSALIFLSGFSFPDKETVSKSKTYPVVIKVAPMSYDVIATVYPGASNFSEVIKKAIDENNPLSNYSF